MEDGFGGTRTNFNSFESQLTPAKAPTLTRTLDATITKGTFVGPPYLDGARTYVHFVVDDHGTATLADNSFVEAYDKSTGQRLWTSPPLPVDTSSTITIAGNRLLVPTGGLGAGPVSVIELDPSTGSIITQTSFGSGQRLVGSIAFDGTTAAMVLAQTNGTARLWYGRPGNAAGPSTFSNLAIIPGVQTTPPSFTTSGIVVGAGDQVLGYDDSAAADPGSVCVFFSPCSPVWSSVHFTILHNGSNPVFINYPVAYSSSRVAVQLFVGGFLVFNAQNGALAWGSSAPEATTGPPAATTTNLYAPATDGRVFVFSTTDCATAPTTHSCAPTAVFVPALARDQSSVGQPAIAGNVLYIRGTQSLSMYATTCAFSGSDTLSGLPKCGPTSVIAQAIRGLAVTDGAVYATSTAGHRQMYKPA